MGVAISIGVAAAAVAIWGSSDELPAPLVTQADLPVLPDATENGWTEFEALPTDLSLDLPDEVSSALDAAKDEDRPTSERWDALVASSVGLRATTRDRVQALDAWRRAVRAPAFADGCKTNIRKVCAHFLYYRVHQVVLADTAQLAVNGQWERANDQLADAIRLDRELLASCRNSMSAFVAVTVLAEALPLAHLFAQHHQGSNARLRAEIDALTQGDLLDGLDVQHRVVVGGYLYGYQTLQTIEDEGVSVLIGDDDWRPAMLYDARHSAALVEAPYLEFMHDKNNPLSVLTGSPPTDFARCDWLSSLRNPIGCANFDPKTGLELRQRNEERIDDGLAVARRWSQRIQDSWNQQ